jgi:ATP-dependent RNA helicase DDX55/SPB4
MLTYGWVAADGVLDVGLEECLNSILECLPKLRRTGLFSATMSSEVAALARAGLRNPRLVTVNVETKQKKLQASLGIMRDSYMNIDIDACIDA